MDHHRPNPCLPETAAGCEEVIISGHGRKASAIKALMNPPVDEPQNPSILFDFLDLFSLVIFEVSILRNTN